MTDPGLTRRLRQQSHRSGLAVGLSMALAIAVCVGGFTWLYVQLDPWVRDLAGAVPAPTATERSEASNNEDDDDEDPTEEPEEVDEEPTETPEERQDGNSGDSGNVSEGDDDENDGDFDPDYQVTSLETVNMRSGAGRNFDVVREVGPGTELEFLGNSEPAPDAEDVGLDWLEFGTEDGAEGWIRDIDVGET